MKNSLFRILIFGIFIFGFQENSAFSQLAKINPLGVKQSNLIEDLKTAKAANPGISTEELVKTANALLDKQGFNYAFVLDENSCRQIEQTRKNQKDPSVPLNLSAKLSSVAGDKVNLVLPPERYEKAECGRCFIYLPVWEATERDFVTFIQNINVKLYLPGNFVLNEMALVDNKDLTTIIRRWKIPFRAAPLSLSDDGKILFLPLAESQLSDLAIMIFEEGVIQFYPKKDIDADKKGKSLKEFPKDAGNPNLSFVSFESGETKQTVRFTAPCRD